jgi:predicted nuclease of restriction endonuclease-like RecB superfamily
LTVLVEQYIINYVSKVRNKFEAKIERQLKKSGVTFSYESERISYLLAGYYLPDFVLSTPTGKVYIETKGYFRPEAKRKLVAVKKLHPEIDLRILFYAYNEKNIKWANRNGIKYAINTIPKEWLHGR